MAHDMATSAAISASRAGEGTEARPSIVNALTNGKMSVQGASLSAPERSAVAQFLTGKVPAVAVAVNQPANRCTAATPALDPAGGPVYAPIFRFTGFTASQVSAVTLDGTPTDRYFASIDAARDELWLTLHGTVTGPVTLHVE